MRMSFRRGARSSTGRNSMNKLSIVSPKLVLRFTLAHSISIANDILKAMKKDEGGLSTVLILDNRAATHSKLKNLRAALSDGQRMIRLAKDKCTVGDVLKCFKTLKLRFLGLSPCWPSVAVDG